MAAGPASYIPDECPHLGQVLACEGFEPDSPHDYVASTTWGGAVQVIPAPSHTGEGVLLTAVDGDQQRAHVRFRTDPVSVGRLYVRAYFRLEGIVNGRVNLMEVGDHFAQGSVDVNVNAKLGMELYFQTPHQTRVASGGSLVPIDRWFCLQLMVDLSDAA